MIRTLIAIGVALALSPVAPVAARDSVNSGAWTASISEDQGDRLSFSMNTGQHGQNGEQFDLAELTGLTAAQVHSPTQVPVRFELRREAGTLSYEGVFRDGYGAGQFTFAPNRDFPRALRALGLELDPKHGDTDRVLFELTIFDVTTEFIRSMQAIGYREPLDKYEQFRIFDVNPTYVRDMARVGFRRLSADKLVETRIHGATPEYIRTMREAGEDLTLDQYVESRIFQVTPAFAAEMARAGYTGLDHSTLTQFRIHDVTPEFVREVSGLGYSHVPAQQLVEMRIHGVTPEFIRRLGAAGYHHVPIEKLVQMRIFSIEPELVKALDDGEH